MIKLIHNLEHFQKLKSTRVKKNQSITYQQANVKTLRTNMCREIENPKANFKKGNKLYESSDTPIEQRTLINEGW